MLLNNNLILTRQLKTRQPQKRHFYKIFLMEVQKMTKFDNLLVAERIKACRKMCEYSQEELAEKLGMKRTNIANYEAGRVIPPGNVVVLMSEIFGVSTDYILGLSDSLNDKTDVKDLKVIQRARTKMSDEDWNRAMKILKLSFVEAFDDDEDEDEDI